MSNDLLMVFVEILGDSRDKEKNMHATATIRNLGNGYTASLGPMNVNVKYCESFEQAYVISCDWVGWEKDYLNIDILPDDIRATINRLDDEHEKKTLEGMVAKTYGDYLTAKKNVENYEKSKIQSSK